MEEDMSYGLEKEHALLLKVMDEIHRICVDNGIRYSLHGGALLGAERNGKLIPWDDDIDISMSRREYQKFESLLEAGNSSDLRLDRDYSWMPRIVKRENETTVFVSIFIWDEISENLHQQHLKIFLLRMFQGMLKQDIDYSQYSTKNKVLIFGTHLLGMAVPGKTKRKWFAVICEKWLTGHGELVHRSNDSYVGVAQVYDKDYVGDYAEIELENRKYMVFSRYRESLIVSYGPDYLTPPPIEERRSAHDIQRDRMQCGSEK